MVMPYALKGHVLGVINLRKCERDQSNNTIRDISMSTHESQLRFYGGAGASILPTLIYVAGTVILSVGFHFSSMKNLTFSAMAGMLIGFFFCKEKKIYWNTIVQGIAQVGNIRLLVAFLLIGVFTTLLMGGNISGGLVWLCLAMGINSHEFVLFVFIASAVISMGTCAPIAALFSVVPIFYPPGILMGITPELLAGAMLSGVFFGDALSPCSQLTQMTLFSQHDSPESEPALLTTLLKSRLPAVLITGLISLVLFGLMPQGNGVGDTSLHDIQHFGDVLGLWMLLPLAVLLAFGFRTQNLFLSLNVAILVGLVTGLLCGSIRWEQIISIDYHARNLHGVIFDGVNSMTDIVVSTLLLYGLISLAKEGGCVSLLCNWISKKNLTHSPKGTEWVISLGIAVTNILLSGSALPAILMFSPVSEWLGQQSGVNACNRCWLLLSVASSFTAIIPLNSVFMMGMVTLIQTMTQHYPWLPPINPFNTFAFSFYCLLLTLACVLHLMMKKSHRQK